MGWLFESSGCCVDMLEGRDAIQRHLDRLERWACASLMRLNRQSAGSCAWVGETPSINTGWGMKGMRAALRRRTLGCWLTRSST